MADLEITADNSFIASKEVLQAKYNDATTWAEWARGDITGHLEDIRNLLGSDIVGGNLAALTAAIDAIALYVPSTVGITYTNPTVPMYDTVPVYAEQTLGTILAIPAVEAITIGGAPGTAITFTNSEFTDSLIDTVKGKLAVDGTGLGTAEAAMFARETARQNAARALAYTEITTQFSARNFDMPPGALLAKQTEINSESGIRLTDSSTAILAESARLAQAWNTATLTTSVQLLDVLSRVFDSKILRDFEAEKTRVTLSIEGFKQEVSVAIAKAELNKYAISATVAANQGTVEVLKAQIEGQVAPMKAISETNQAKASAYSAAVQGAIGDLTAQTMPEELKIKGVEVNSKIAGTKADIALKEASIVIDQAARQLQIEVTTIAGLAQSASQMVAAALNSVSVSSSFGWSASSGYSASEDVNVARTNDVHQTQAL